MKSLYICLPAIAVGLRLLAAPDGAPAIVNARELDASLYDGRTDKRPFAFEALVSFPSRKINGSFALEDATGTTRLYDRAFWPTNKLLAGDRIIVRGFVEHASDGNNYATATNIVLLAHEQPPTPTQATFDDINAGKFINRVISMEGVVLDSFRDEIDPRFAFLVLTDGRETVYVSLSHSEADGDCLAHLLGARVRVSGLCTDYRHKLARQALGFDISIDGLSAVEIVSQPPDDPFDVPMLHERTTLIHQSSNNAYKRLKIHGKVIATWNRNRMIVETSAGEFSNVRLAESMLPEIGQFVEVVGLPETDFYRWNLARARWRDASGISIPSKPPLQISAKGLLVDKSGHPMFNAMLHGQTVRLRGIVQRLPTGDGDGRMLLDCDGFSVAIDAGSTPESLRGLERNSTIEVCGVCVMETEVWSVHTPFPHIEACFIVVCGPDDVHVLKRPPWWTVGKLAGIVFSLLSVLTAFVVWNRMLQRLVDKKGRQLFKEQIASASSNLRFEERTRLAVELHDSLSQNLTGISMQIDAAERQLSRRPEKTLAHLGIASRTLDSCREELRNCIWDLRSQALEEHDMNKVIRMSLLRQAEGCELHVRFSIPRRRLSDNTVHCLIRIIRELATNAVRHGKARHVRVAGAIDSDKLIISLSDDGIGFDPDNRPGPSDGHFGLQGVYERIRRLNGTFSISSTPGNGAKVKMVIPIHLGEVQNGCD
jgi:signal transduction histidine kinase